MDWRRHAFNYEALCVGGVFPERVKLIGVEDVLVSSGPYLERFGGGRDGDTVVSVAEGEVRGVC